MPFQLAIIVTEYNYVFYFYRKYDYDMLIFRLINFIKDSFRKGPSFRENVCSDVSGVSPLLTGV